MTRMVMIADDLTGAADCAAACAAHGISAAVLLHARAESGSLLRLPDADILSIDADTRCLSAERAAAATSELVRLCQTRGALGAGSLLFKKLDSTLRGNIAAELAAVLHARRDQTGDEKLAMIMAPALPAQGRTTVGGRQLVHGRPLEETDLWKRKARAPQSEIAALLAEESLSCSVIDVATVRHSLSNLRGAMVKLAQEADVVLCDAETDQDLRVIAEASMVFGGRTVWAGSAGLASQLPHTAGIARASGSAVPVNFAAGPTLFVVGSAASVTREQASVLAAMPDMVTVRLPLAMLLGSQATATLILEGLQSNRDVLVLLEDGERCSAHETKILTRALSKMIAPCAQLLGGLVATGGETARAILDDLGIRTLRLLGEVESGLPFSVADERPQFPVLTKAGAFGSPQTLVRCRQFLQTLERTSAQAEAQRPLVSRES